MSNGTGPSQVLIIRHGEKLGSDKDGDGGVDLSPLGSTRAMALPSLFVPAESQIACALASTGNQETGAYAPVTIQGNAPRFAMPAFVFATKASSNSNRPIETVSALVAAFQPTFNGSYSDKDYGTVANLIRTGSAHVGAVVLICWHHGNIPNLAIALGIKQPPAFPGSVFDRVWQLTFTGGIPFLQDLPQQLLYGDSCT